MDDDQFRKWERTAFNLGRCIGMLQIIRDEPKTVLPSRVMAQLVALLVEVEPKESNHESAIE